MHFEGIYTPVITPMGPEREIDEEGWVEVIEHLLGQGMHGLVLGGTTGENYALTKEERIRQFQFGNEVIAGRVPWVAGVNDIRTEDVCEYAVAARPTRRTGRRAWLRAAGMPRRTATAGRARATDHSDVSGS